MKSNLVGLRTKLLEVISEAEPRLRKDGKYDRYWNCICACGNTVVVLHSNLTVKSQQSCGCLADGQHEVRKKDAVGHGLDEKSVP